MKCMLYDKNLVSVSRIIVLIICRNAFFIISLQQKFGIIMKKHLQYLLGDNFGKTTYSQWCEEPGVVESAVENDVVCKNCGTKVTGNYCPRCGQAASTARFSFKTAGLRHSEKSFSCIC